MTKARSMYDYCRGAYLAPPKREAPMTKPWEETWDYRNDRVQLAPADETRTIATFVNEGLTPHDEERDGGVMQCLARTRLAAAAPEMARLLLRLRDQFDPEHQDWAWTNEDTRREIDTVLRKAGVRP
jgi:hypothetical protein